jgi:hypothetical protein
MLPDPSMVQHSTPNDFSIGAHLQIPEDNQQLL